MIWKIFVVDDNTDRAKSLVKEAAGEGLEVQWYFPRRDADQASSGDMAIVDSAADLGEILKVQPVPAIWLWDVGLNFKRPPVALYETNKYAKGDPLFDSMLSLMKAGHAFVFTSDTFGVDLLRRKFVAAGADSCNVVCALDVDGAELSEFSKSAIRLGVQAMEGSILSSISSISLLHFTGASHGPFVGVLPHNLPSEMDAGALKIKSILKTFGGMLTTLTAAPSTVLTSILSGNEVGVYEAVKTLVGAHAKAHTESGTGHVPSLGILPLLLLRALARSGRWSDSDILKLFRGLRWTDSLRSIDLCSTRQDRHRIRAWLAVLGDKIFPALSLNQARNGKSDLLTIELNDKGRFFRLVFDSEWPDLVEAVDRHDGEGGDAYLSWDVASKLMGACGPTIGRDTRCTISVYIYRNQTYFDFRAAA